MKIGGFHFKNRITVDVATNKVMACMIPYLKNPLIIGDFIFAVSAYFSIFRILNVHRVAVGVAIGLHFGVAVGLQGLHDF